MPIKLYRRESSAHKIVILIPLIGHTASYIVDIYSADSSTSIFKTIANQCVRYATLMYWGYAVKPVYQDA